MKFSFPLFVPLALLLASAIGRAETTWHVDASNANCPGSGTPADPFCTIGAAIDAAFPGDTILVAAGTYSESVLVQKEDLALIGSGADRTTIVGEPTSSVVSTAGLLAGVARFAIRGFHVTTSDPGPGLVIGISLFQGFGTPGSTEVRGCRIEGCDVGIRAMNAFNGSTILIEEAIVTDCASGVSIYGSGVVVRGCTVVSIAGGGIESLGPCCSSFDVENTVIAECDYWAIGRTYGETTNLDHLLVYATNLSNPPNVPNAGPFMEVLHEGNGFWFAFAPTPGPTLSQDPLFYDSSAGDYRLQSLSPAIDAGDPGTVADPVDPYDVLGFGHPRVADGDLDRSTRVDLGAVEFGGLLSPGAVEVGEIVTIELRGFPGGLYAVFAGLPGSAIDLGPLGTFFLLPASALPIVAGVLPPSGIATVASLSAPPGLVGLTVHFQGASLDGIGGGAIRLTNLEALQGLP